MRTTRQWLEVGAMGSWLEPVVGAMDKKVLGTPYGANSSQYLKKFRLGAALLKFVRKN